MHPTSNILGMVHKPPFPLPRPRLIAFTATAPSISVGIWPRGALLAVHSKLHVSNDCQIKSSMKSHHPTHAIAIGYPYIYNFVISNILNVVLEVLITFVWYGMVPYHNARWKHHLDCFTSAYRGCSGRRRKKTPRCWIQTPGFWSNFKSKMIHVRKQKL